MEDRAIEILKAQTKSLMDVYGGLPAGREKSLAITKLEEALLWGIQAIKRTI